MLWMALLSNPQVQKQLSEGAEGVMGGGGGGGDGGVADTLLANYDSKAGATAVQEGSAAYIDALRAGLPEKNPERGTG